VGWLPLLGVFVLAACGGRSRDESRLGPIEIDAGSGASTDEPSVELIRGCPGAATIIAGLDRCSDGVYHRTDSWQCEIEPPPQGELTPEEQATIMQFLADGGNPRRVECMSHGDCTEHRLGSCFVDIENNVVSSCFYTCFNDDDCSAGTACYCAGNTSTCVPARCRSDADCLPGFACTSPDALSWTCEHPRRRVPQQRRLPRRTHLQLVRRAQPVRARRAVSGVSGVSVGAPSGSNSNRDFELEKASQPLAA
jgi:hypothetical protein